jgi:hypothetical protein
MVGVAAYLAMVRGKSPRFAEERAQVVTHRGAGGGGIVGGVVAPNPTVISMEERARVVTPRGAGRGGIVGGVVTPTPAVISIDGGPEGLGEVTVAERPNNK